MEKSGGNYLFVVSPLKSLSRGQLQRMEELGHVMVLEDFGDYTTQIIENITTGNYGELEVLISHAGDGGNLKVAEAAQALGIAVMPLPAGTGNDVAISMLKGQGNYAKISKQDAKKLHSKFLGALKEGKVTESFMDSLKYTVYDSESETYSRRAYIGHHIHMIAKAGKMTGKWKKLKKLGSTAYVLRGIAGILGENSTDLKISLEGRRLESLNNSNGQPEWVYEGNNHVVYDDVWGGQILNTPTTGGGKLRIEGEVADDGRFAFIYMPCDSLSKLGLLRISNKLDKAVYLKGVSAFHGIEKMTLESEKGFDLGVDGEMYLDLVNHYSGQNKDINVYKLEVEIEPKALKLYVPLLS